LYCLFLVLVGILWLVIAAVIIVVIVVVAVTIAGSIAVAIAVIVIAFGPFVVGFRRTENAFQSPAAAVLILGFRGWFLQRGRFWGRFSGLLSRSNHSGLVRLVFE
jgi:hypothetical protein